MSISGVASQTLAEKRKKVNQGYYARKKEKFGKLGDGEGTSLSTVLTTNFIEEIITPTSRQQLERVPFENLQNQWYFSRETRSFTNEASTSHGTPVVDKENIIPHGANKVAQNRKDTNRNYYKRSKEKKRILENIHQQGNIEGLSTTKETIQQHHVTRREENNEICSGLTHQSFNGKKHTFYKILNITLLIIMAF